MSSLLPDSAPENSSSRSFDHQVAIALGSNLGDSEAILAGAVERLRHTPHVRVERVSSVFMTTPVGPPQPDYLNACATLATDLTPRQVLMMLLDIEAQFGRERRERWGPRRLDLDLLLVGDRTIEEPGLQIPHSRMTERAFVLVPLTEIAPDWIHPLTGQAIAQLLKDVDQSGVTLKTVSCSAS